MNRTLSSIFALTFAVLPCCVTLGQQKNLQPGLYDEAKVPHFTLPDPLTLHNGRKVTDTRTWNQKRRGEILSLFETYVYGRTLVQHPKEMTWEVLAENRQPTDTSGITKKIRIYFTADKSGPKLDLNITLPAKGSRPAPVFLVPGWVREPNVVLGHGYGVVTFNPWDIEPDKQDSSYFKSIRKLFDPPGRTESAPDEWGAIGAWAWGTSRAMDYLETDRDIDAHKVCIMGLSRFGKVVMWAGAQDQRFAIVFSCESGCGGAVLVRRGFGETVRSINGYAPHWFDGNFKTYGDRVNELPVDWHMLIALMAPRPVYIATAEDDLWGDPKGSFLAAKYAEPVYALFGERGLGVDSMPPVETPVGDNIGFHNRKGGHGLNTYDWEQFLNFADRHFGSVQH